jgi:hypothetical protein
VVQGNLIGTDVSGTVNLGNLNNGVHLLNASGNTIGGTVDGTANVIAYNGHDGLLVDGGSGNPIQQNSIIGHDNSLGIELANGGNNQLPFPVLTSATSDGTTTTITGLLQSTPNTTFTLEFFANLVSNPSGFGEGQQFLGSTTVTTNGLGTASFMVTFAVVVPPGQFVAATATDPNNNTSAFSNCIGVAGPPAPAGLASGKYETGTNEIVVQESIAFINGIASPKLGKAVARTILEGSPPPLERREVDVLFSERNETELQFAATAPMGLRDDLPSG